jgi:hypothetical protein
VIPEHCNERDLSRRVRRPCRSPTSWHHSSSCGKRHSKVHRPVYRRWVLVFCLCVCLICVLKFMNFCILCGHLIWENEQKGMGQRGGIDSWLVYRIHAYIHTLYVHVYKEYAHVHARAQRFESGTLRRIHTAICNSGFARYTIASDS